MHLRVGFVLGFVGITKNKTERTKTMYRDLVGEVIKITANGNKWYYQQFYKLDGNLDCVRLYDEDGDCVGEFHSMDDMVEFVKGVA